MLGGKILTYSPRWVWGVVWFECRVWISKEGNVISA